MFTKDRYIDTQHSRLLLVNFNSFKLVVPSTSFQSLKLNSMQKYINASLASLAVTSMGYAANISYIYIYIYIYIYGIHH